MSLLNCLVFFSPTHLKNSLAVKMGIIIFPKLIFWGWKFQQICGKNHHPVKGSHPPLGGVDPIPSLPWPPSSCGTPRPCRRRHPPESPVVVLIVGLIKGNQWVFMKPWFIGHYFRCWGYVGGGVLVDLAILSWSSDEVSVFGGEPCIKFQKKHSFSYYIAGYGACSSRLFTCKY